MPDDTAVTIRDHLSAAKPLANNLAQEQPISLASPSGLVSILIPCCGQLEYTKLCIASVLRYSRKPYELIFLDIGSLDGTREFIAGIAAAAQVRVEVVRTPPDLGIAGAVQGAVKLARGEFLLLLNNDTIVTDGWLDKMVDLAQLMPGIGVVGPMSNYADAPQRVEKVPYRIGPKKGGPSDWLVATEAIDAFARKMREENRNKYRDVDRLGGFCLLIKREILKRVGHLRESSELGLFDSDLLCRSARQAGFTLACCTDVYIHHFGTRTFAHGAPKAEADAKR
jgi:O-antigen biosynthesis protein